MFKRTLSIHKGIPNALAVRFFGTSQKFANTANTTTVFDVSDSKAVAEYRQKTEALLQKELPKPYDGPERDYVNFPRRIRPTLPGKVRMGFLPDEWFTFFYKKTGVTGPYVFGTGLLTFFLSKEWYVIEEEFSTGCALFLLIYFSVKKFGPAVRKLLEEENAKDAAKANNVHAGSMQYLEDAIAEENKAVWQAEGQKILIAAKKENVQMQLETEYRRRWMHVYEQVKKRLDYQLDTYNTRRKLEQKHMVDWIVNSVVKSITPQQEKEALQKCIEDLKVLSAQAH